ncbi:hypothetical protein [Pseudomonas sp. GL93]|uniref:hypothetical protein n=1 Tax=Pseudomonas sp. GL93 TaxID=2014741 RepID=UPI00105860C2|nr:hypothetical protein [Pseudomonas sp. GL93]
MLLRIQRDESIRSFVERNIFILGKGLFPNWYVSKRITTEDIRYIASLLKWHGCFGFNRVLHNHTHQPLQSFFKNFQDMAYSGSKYIAEFADVDPAFPKSLTFCPECVKADLATLGFSYWRRASLESVGVCAIHNVILESICSQCDRPFTSQGHSRNVMWEGCGGKYLSETATRVNNNLAELKRARIVDEIYECQFHVSLIPALEALSMRFSLISSRKSSKTLDQEKLFKLSNIVCTSLVLVKEHAINNVAFYFERIDFEAIIDSITMLYDSFQDFLSDVVAPCDQLRAYTSLWSTYRAGGHESAHYVDENYSLGVGYWYCPYPSPLSLEYGRGDYIRTQSPIAYACCSFVDVKDGGVQRASSWADPPHPAIPVI